MRLDENGKLVLETRACFMCDGKGQKREILPCPKYGQAMRGKACSDCGSKTKHGHKHMDTGRMIPCPTCKGTGILDENICDTADAIYLTLPFKVYRQDRAASWNESNFGAGCVYSSCDYGAAWNANDDAALIENVKSHGFVQAIKFARDDGTVANHIGIFVTRGGYSVRAVFTMAETLNRIAGEPDETTARVIGGALAGAGMNGTAFAAGGLS